MSAIILVHLGARKIGKVLEDCIAQLKRTQTNDTTIYLYVDDVTSVEDVKGLEYVTLVTPNTVPKTAMHNTFSHTSRHNNSWYYGYWQLCSRRFCAIHDVAEHFQLKHFFHIETDILLYYPVTSILPVLVSKNVNIGMTLLSDSLVVPGIIYYQDSIASQRVASYIASRASTGINDMQVLGNMCNDTSVNRYIFPLPVVPAGYCSDPKNLWSRDQAEFGCVFDGAALGQWIGGVDKVCNIEPFDAPYVNTQASYKFVHANITWDELHRPYVNGVPVFNLHVHSKQLYRWCSHD